MTFASVQHKYKLSQTAGATSITLDAAPTAGNLLVFSTSVYPIDSTITPPTGFTAIGVISGSSGSGGQYLAAKISDGTETTLSYTLGTTGGGIYDEVLVEEFSGFSAYSGGFEVDGTIASTFSNTNTAGTTLTYPAAPAAAGEFALAMYNTNGATSSSTSSTGWTQLHAASGSNNNTGYAFMAAGTTSAAPSITVSWSSSANFTASLIVLKPVSTSTDVTVTGVASTVAFSAPAGSVTATAPDATVAGTAATVAFSAPAGNVVATEPISKVLLVIEENHTLTQALDGMTYLAGLCTTYGYASGYKSITHPSLPNYLAIAAGTTFDLADDDPPSINAQSGSSVFGQAITNGFTAKTYCDGMTSNNQQTDSGEYVVKHNPWAYFTDEATDAATYDVPAGTTTSGNLHDDIAANTLPNVGFLIPNLTNDAHDGTLSDADTYLSDWLPDILASDDFTSGRLLVLVTFDEDDQSGDNTVLTAVLHPTLSGSVVSTALNHYSLTRLFAELVGATPLNNGATAASLTDAFSLDLAPVSIDATVAGEAGTVAFSAPAGTVTATSTATVAGVAGTVALSAPAGSVSATENPTVSGVAGTVAFSAPAGSVSTSGSVAVTGAAATVAFTAPAGTISTTESASVSGNAGTVAFTAPAGTIDTTASATVDGAAGTVAFTAPAGVVVTGGSVAVAGDAGTVSFTAPAGTVTVTRTVTVAGVTATMALTAPAGEVSAGTAATVEGAAGTVAFTAPAGEVTATTDADIAGPTGTVTFSAPAGSVRTDVNITGPAATISFLAAAGAVVLKTFSLDYSGVTVRFRFAADDPRLAFTAGPVTFEEQ